MRTLSQLLLTLSLLLSAPLALAQAQAGWNASVRVPAITLGDDSIELEVLHQTLAGTDKRLLFIIVTPRGGTPQTLLAIGVAEMQAFVTAVNKIFSLVAADGSSITVDGQSAPLRISVVEIRRAGNFALTQTVVANRTVYQLQIHQPIFDPYFYRNYTLAELQQLVSYLSLGIAYVNALP
jgi:hypothetical protein